MKLGQLRLLFLLPFSPRLDATHGGGRIAAQLLAHLSIRHRIALIYLRTPADPPLDPALQECCELVEEVMRPNPGFSLTSGWTRIQSLSKGWPLWVAGCSVSAFHSRLRILSGKWKPDIIQVEFHVMAQYLSALDDCSAPRVLNQHEPGAQAARDIWKTSRGMARVIRYFDMLAWERFEGSISNQVQAIVVFSERDRHALAQVAQETTITRIPFGTVLPEQPLNPHGDEPLNLLFVGNFIHPPNVDAAVRLINAIFPRVQAHIPGVRLHIVGDQPTAQMRELANETIVVTGRVPDVTPYLDRAAVVVAPLRLGGGMRVKVLEALAAGKAVVASRLAVEGLDVVDGKQILLAETDKQFIDAIIQLLAYTEKRTSLAVCARAWACANLGWEKSIAAYEALYESLIQRPGGRGERDKCLLDPCRYERSSHGTQATFGDMAGVTQIAVAISTLDRPESLSRCLDALLSGDVLPAEVIIVDQSRNEATRSMIEERQSSNVPIIYIRQEPRGLAASQNAAIGHASYPIVAVTDDDCIPEKRWLATIEKTFASANGLAAVTGRILPLDPEGDKLYPVSSRTGTLRVEFSDKVSPWVVGSGNNFAVKRDWFSRIGGCDERLGPGSPGKGGVDMDLFYRLLRAGGRIRYEPESLVYHERQDKVGRIARRSMYGYGMGACCTIWLRQRDIYGLYIFGSWSLFRIRRLVTAALSLRWMSVHEELLVLGGTAGGLVYGLFVKDSA